MILSGVDDKDVEAEAYHRGAQEFLVKGDGIADLGRAVARAIARKRAESEFPNFLSSITGNVVVGDDVISVSQPAEVLVVGSREVEVVRRATEQYACSFVLSEAASLEDARRMLTLRSFDAVVLNPDLPDAWPTSSYAILAELVGDIPVLVLSDIGQEISGIPSRLPRPFGEVRKTDDTTIQLRRLLVSAILRRRSSIMPSHPRELPQQPYPNFWH